MTRPTYLPAAVFAAVTLALAAAPGSALGVGPSAPTATLQHSITPSLLSAAPPAAAAPSKRPPVRRVMLPNGLKLLCKPNDASEIVAIVVQVRAGLPDEPEHLPGVAATTAEALLRGTSNHTRQGFNQALVNAGGDLRAQNGFDFTEISAVTDRDRWPQALKLVADAVARPSFEPEQLEEVRAVLKRRIASFEDDFTGGTYQVMMGQLYRRGPYGRPLYGLPSTINRITANDVRKFWRDCYVQPRITVAVVGDVDPNAVVKAAQTAFDEIPAGSSESARPIPSDTIDRPRVELVQRPGPGGQIMAGYLAPPSTAANYPVYSVLEAVISGGKRSRLFTNVRDEQGIGYVLGSTYQPLAGKSHLVGFMVFPVPPADRGAPVLETPKQMLLKQFRDLAATGPTDVEVARAKAFAIGQHALRHERNRDQAKWLAWFEAAGLGYRTDQDFASLAGAVTKEQVHAAAKEVFKNYALVISLPPPD